MPSTRRWDDNPLVSGDWQALAWTLFLLDNLSAAGIAPIHSALVHRLQFFSNSLAPVYKTVAPAALVMKLERGPFYPEAADDLDFLAISGLAHVSNVRWHKGTNHTWKTAEYVISDVGFTLSRKLIKDSFWCELVFQFLHDLVFAYADLEETTAEKTLKVDLIYGQKGVSVGSVIPFGRPEENLSVKGTEELNDLFPSGFSPNRRNSLRIYLKYLESLAA